LIIGFYNPVTQNSFVSRTQLRVKVAEKIELGAGFAYFSVATQDPKVKTGFIFLNIDCSKTQPKQALGKEFDTSIHARRTVCS
jgi:hypothetical protein